MKKEKNIKKKKGSPIWLVIFLSGLIIGLALLLLTVKHNLKVDLLNSQIKTLMDEVNEVSKEKQDKEHEIERLKQKIVSPLATASASPQPSSSTKVSSESAIIKGE